MVRADFQRLSRLRLREARTLLQASFGGGGYYLAGYAVECAYRFEFPDRESVNDSYTHDLSKLVRLAGLGTDHQARIQGNNTFQVNWAMVKLWTEQSRYDPTIKLAKARDFYRAALDGRTV
jgi:hypothetical protein